MKALGIVFALLAGTVAQAVVVIGNYPQTNDSAISADLTMDRMKALGFIAPLVTYGVDSVKVRLHFTEAGLGQVPVVQLHYGTSTEPGPIFDTLTAPGGYVVGAGDYVFTGVAGLTALEKFWISVSGENMTSGMGWLGSSPGITPTGPATHEGSVFTANAGANWSSSDTLNTYELRGHPLPEPASFIVLGIGVAVALLRRRRVS